MGNEQPIDDLSDDEFPGHNFLVEEIEPAEPPGWLRAPSLRTLAAVAMGGVSFDLVFRAPIGLVTAFCLALVIASAAVARWATQRSARVALAGATVLAVLLMWRASWWLVPLNILAALGLVMLASELRDEPRAVPRALGRL